MIQVIDFLVNSLTTTDAQRMGQGEQNNLVAGQNNQGENRVKESQLASEGIVETDGKDESSMVNAKGHGQGKAWLRQQKKQQEEEKKKKEIPILKDPNRGLLIDIKK